eukprot:7864489-Pyramimonas_sp.AAC.2
MVGAPVYSVLPFPARLCQLEVCVEASRRPPATVDPSMGNMCFPESCEAAGARMRNRATFQLMASFPPTPLTEFSKTLKDAGLIGAVVIQKL